MLVVVAMITSTDPLLAADVAVQGDGSTNTGQQKEEVVGSGFLHIKWSYPQLAAVEIGCVVGSAMGGNGSQGLAVSVEPGIYGMKVNIGYGGNDDFGLMMLGASYYYQWDDHYGISSGEQYYGGQATLRLLPLVFSIGAYFSPSSNRGLLSGSIGIGIGPR
jgi:hypothetical protein